MKEWIVGMNKYNGTVYIYKNVEDAVANCELWRTLWADSAGEAKSQYMELLNDNETYQ